MSGDVDMRACVDVWHANRHVDTYARGRKASYTSRTHVHLQPESGKKGVAKRGGEIHYRINKTAKGSLGCRLSNVRSRLSVKECVREMEPRDSPEFGERVTSRNHGSSCLRAK